VTDRITYLAYAVGWAVVRALPERVALRLFQWGADFAWRRRGKGVLRLESNLRRVLGPEVEQAELDATVRAGVRSYARYWLDVFRLPVTSEDRIVSGMHTIDEWRLRETLASGRGAVVALPHQGNWDHAGAWAVVTGMPFTTVAERLKPERLFDRFVGFRESLGMEVVPLTGGDRPAYEILTERLRAGGMICLLADRDLTATGVTVDFFGAAARFPAGPAALALRTGAALLPVTLWYDDGGDWHVQFHPEVVPSADRARGGAIADMTQQVAARFEQGVREHPQDWHMLQRLWLDDLDAAAPSRPAPAAEQPADEGAA
jgi:phosphatidylinositol dimannoside acyltransferase